MEEIKDQYCILEGDIICHGCGDCDKPETWWCCGVNKPIDKRCSCGETYN